jgi:uncharacterized protein YndB with AHSA1/START domain
MAKKILGVVAVLIAVFAIVVGTRPNTFEIKRSLLINAPPELVFDQVDDFQSWLNWSPWDKLDPSMKRTLNDVPSGVGAGYHWVGNKDVGEGRMKITDAKAPEHLGLDLEFIAPFAAKNRTDFDFAKTGEGTTVTWTMSGSNNFMSKAMSLFMDMDKMVGPDFERGLGAMKTVAETQFADAAKKAAEDKAAAEAAAAAQAAPTDAADAGVDAGTP